MTERNLERYRILACVDGSDESHRGLRYATKFSLDHDDTDITLLYVRPDDKQLGSAGLNFSVARENLLEWDIDLPGLKSLKQARDTLVEMGFLGEEWAEHGIEKRARGSRLGNHMIDYVSTKSGQHIRLKVRVAPSVVRGILDEAAAEPYDIVIVSASKDGVGAGHIDLDAAISVASEHDGTVILARDLEEGRGHLVCVTPSDISIDLARKDAIIAARCGCPIHLYAIAEENSGRAEAETMLEKIRDILREGGIDAASAEADVGDPVGRIIEKGQEHSLIALSATEKSMLKRMFVGSVSREVLRKAKNSVMIVR